MNNDRFLIFPWGVLSSRGEDAEALLTGIKECNFNASCFVRPEDFELCRRLGLTVFCVLPCHEAVKSILYQQRKNMTADEAAEALKAAIEPALRDLDEDVFSIYITDEPGASLYPELRVLADCVRRIRPNTQTHINLLPNYAVAGAKDLSQLETETYEEYLDRFCAEVNPHAVSVDNYQVHFSNEFTRPGGREKFWNNMLQCIDVCKKYGLPFHFVASCCQLRTDRVIPTFPNLALQAYGALAAGARALSWFYYRPRGLYVYCPTDDYDSEIPVKTPVWYLLQEVNRRILALGTVLYGMEFNGLYFTDPKTLREGAKSVAECPALKGFSADGVCAVGHYTDLDGTPAVLVVNEDLTKPTRIFPDLGGEIETYNTESESWVSPRLANGRGALTDLMLEPGCGLLLRKKK